MPFNTPQARAEQRRRRLANKKRLYADLVPLMNDTKWREVFVTIASRGIWFQWQLVDYTSDVFSPLISTPPPDTSKRDRNDSWSGVFNDFFFWEIWRVRCPAVVRGALVRSVHDRQQDLAGLLDALRALGEIPIAEAEDYLEIRGYAPTASGSPPMAEPKVEGANSKDR